MTDYGITSRYAMCVKLGGRKYLNTLYDVDRKDFFRGWDKFNSPEAKTTKKMKRLCWFCEHRVLNCPIFSFKEIDVKLL